MAFIYKITNPNGRIYIGQTTNIKSRVAAKELGLNQSNIHSACVGKTKSCGNFIWVKKETTL